MKIVDEDNDLISIVFKPLPDLSTHFKRREDSVDCISILSSTGAKDLVDILVENDTYLACPKLRLEMMGNLNTNDLHQIFERCLHETSELSLFCFNSNIINISTILPYSPNLERLECDVEMSVECVEWIRQHPRMTHLTFYSHTEILPHLLQIPHLQQIRVELIAIFQFDVDMDQIVDRHLKTLRGAGFRVEENQVRVTAEISYEMIVHNEYLMFSKI